MTFDEAVSIVGVEEGRFSEDRRDRGNWTSGRIGEGEFKGTKYGISAASYPNLDIKNLSWQDAKEIYKRDFWDRYLVGSVGEGVRLFYFDSMINHGPAGGIRLLQRAVGATVDGVIGPRTISKTFGVSPFAFALARSDYYVEITQNGKNDENDRVQLKGWLRRNLHILEYSLKNLPL